MNAIIPARGGSKGIPGKNICYICGKPLIAWTIEAAKNAKSINRVIVSTDDPRIAEISQQYGAEIIWRSQSISGDESSSEEALLHALDVFQNENNLSEITVFLQCTSPLTASEDIDGAVALLQKGYDSVFTVTPCDLTLWDENGCINRDPINRATRRQERRKGQYVETGAVYAFRTKGFLEYKNRFFGQVGYYVTPGPYCEIDEPEDLAWAEILLRKRQKFIVKPSALVLDFDGVFTDNTFILNEDGKEAVACNRGDGHVLQNLNIPVYVISEEKNPVARKRCEKLGIPCRITDNKLEVLKTVILTDDLSNVVYVGNDLNDLECMKACYSVAPADAYEEILPYANYVLKNKGGQGAIREIAQLIQKGVRI